MNKREIVKWLERKRIQKMENLELEYEKAKEELSKTYYCKVDWNKYAVRMRGSIAMLKECFDAMEQETGWARKSGVYDLNQALDQIQNATVPDIAARLRTEFYFPPEYHEKKNNMDANFHNAKKNCSKQWNNVITGVQNCSNAKMAVEYLRSLGINVQEIENKQISTQCVALAVPVNVAQLALDKEGN